MISRNDARTCSRCFGGNFGSLPIRAKQNQQSAVHTHIHHVPPPRNMINVVVRISLRRLRAIAKLENGSYRPERRGRSSLKHENFTFRVQRTSGIHETFFGTHVPLCCIAWKPVIISRTSATTYLYIHARTTVSRHKSVARQVVVPICVFSYAKDGARYRRIVVAYNRYAYRTIVIGQQT